MSESDVNLASLISSRICHDLISPIGAITNGLELLDMVGGVQGPEMELISGSVGNAGARIRFFRIAFGASGEQPLGRTEIAGLLKDIELASRVRVQWGPAESKPRNQVKLAFLAIQCCESAMPMGGEIEVICNEDQWEVTGVADKLNIESDVWQSLNALPISKRITPALVQFALLPETAKTMGRRVRADTTSTRVTIRF